MPGYARRDDYADACPHCTADLRGDAIPAASRANYGGALRFSRLIGIVKYDRVVEWQCPDCGYTWPTERERAYRARQEQR